MLLWYSGAQQRACQAGGAGSTPAANLVGDYGGCALHGNRFVAIELDCIMLHSGCIVSDCEAQLNALSVSSINCYWRM